MAAIEENRRLETRDRTGWRPPLGRLVLFALAAALFIPVLTILFISTYLIVFLLVLALPIAGLVSMVVTGKGKGRREERRWTETSMETSMEETPASATFAPATIVTAEQIMSVDIFRDLTEGQARHVADMAQMRRFEPDSIIAERSTHGDTVFAILAGQVELHVDSGAGEVTVRIVEAGEALPLAALVGDGELITSARAMTAVEAAALPADALRRLCSDEPDIGRKIYAAIAEILAERYRRMLSRLATTYRDAMARTELWANV